MLAGWCVISKCVLFNSMERDEAPSALGACLCADANCPLLHHVPCAFDLPSCPAANQSGHLPC